MEVHWLWAGPAAFRRITANNTRKVRATEIAVVSVRSDNLIIKYLWCARSANRRMSEGGKFRIDSLFGKIFWTPRFNHLAHFRLGERKKNTDRPTERMGEPEISTRDRSHLLESAISPWSGNPRRHSHGESTTRSRS